MDGDDFAGRTVELENEVQKLKVENTKLKEELAEVKKESPQEEGDKATKEEKNEDLPASPEKETTVNEPEEPDSPPPPPEPSPEKHPSSTSSKKSGSPPVPIQQTVEDEVLAILNPEVEPEPEVPPYSSPPPAAAYRDIVSPMPPTPVLIPPPPMRLSEHHKDIISMSLTAFNDRLLLRQKMEVWVAFVVQRQQLRTKWNSNMRGAVLVHQFTGKLLQWRAYHTWRLWFTMRRRNPQAFGMVPRALIYDPAEPEVGDIETIKERITYHNNEINELSNTLRRHGEVAELLKIALKKRLDDEVARLQHQTANILHDKHLWGTEPEIISHPVIEYHDPMQEQQQQHQFVITDNITSHPVPTDPLAVAISPDPLPQSLGTPISDMFSVPFRGYISKGSDSCPPRWLTIEEARIQALRDPLCEGITYNVRQSAPGGRFLIYFKQKNDVHVGSSGWCSYTRDNNTVGTGAAKVIEEPVEIQSPTTAFGSQVIVQTLSSNNVPIRNTTPTVANPITSHSLDNYETVTPILTSGSPGHTRSPQKLNDPCTVLKRLNLDPFQRRRLINFYQGYNPSKLPSVIHTLHEFCGHEDALFRALCEQYGPEPPLVDPVLPQGWRLTESSKGDLFYKHISGRKQWQSPEP